MREDNGHNAVRLDMIQIMEQEGVIRLSFWRQTKAGKARISFLVCGVPSLRIRRIGDDCIHIQGIIGLNGVVVIKIRPVLFESIAIAGNDIVRLDPAHHQIHAGQVVGVFLQLLCVVLDIVGVRHILGDALANVDQQRS